MQKIIISIIITFVITALLISGIFIAVTWNIDKNYKSDITRRQGIINTIRNSYNELYQANEDLQRTNRNFEKTISRLQQTGLDFQNTNNEFIDLVRRLKINQSEIRQYIDSNNEKK